MATVSELARVEPELLAHPAKASTPAAASAAVTLIDVMCPRFLGASDHETAVTH